MTVTTRKPAGAKAAGPRPSRKTGGGGLRDDLKRFTHERLIAAAMDSFAAEGFRATSVERIVELAGTTAPTFYRHFSSKNELLKPLQQRLRDEVRGVVAEIERIRVIDGRSIRIWLDSYVSMWMRMHKLCAAYWEAIELDDDVAADAIPSSLAAVSAVSGFLERFAEPARSSVHLRLALVIPLLDRAVQTISALRDDGLKERMLDEFANMIALSLRHPGPVD